MSYIYKHPIKGAKDITAINTMIRRDVRKARTRQALVELAKRSLYLYTLTYSPAWKLGFKGKVKAMRKRARAEYHKTVALINKKIPGTKLDARLG